MIRQERAKRARISIAPSIVGTPTLTHPQTQTHSKIRRNIVGGGNGESNAKMHEVCRNLLDDPRYANRHQKTLK